MEKLSPQQAATVLGVSRRKVYALAAPDGPIPCYRIGTRISFDLIDLTEYLSTCRYTETKRAVVSSLNSTVRLGASESGLESYFQKRGLKPKLTPSTARNPPGSMRSGQPSNVRSISSRMP